MNDKVIDMVTEILVGKFKLLGADKFNLNDLLEKQTDPISDRVLTEQEKNEIEERVLQVINYKKSYDGALLVPISVVTDPREHEEWYDEWLIKNNNETDSYYWKRLEDYLSSVLADKYGPEKAGVIVKSIDEATYGIIKKLSNPQRKKFNYKGLVVGYVQSGKTANFSALIAKAADAGYKFIVVLGGIHNILRLQTQIRLDKELTGMNDRGVPDIFIKEPADRKRWNRLSSAGLENDGEFSAAILDPFSSICKRSTPTIAVIKKNVKVMERLIKYIEKSDLDCRKYMPLLIIDDEADQASIDTNAKDPDTEPSETNKKIRKLLGMFPKKAYVGYTATPFANVLIDMKSEKDTLGYDLYPRNFIVSLPEPQGYFGTSTIFRGTLSDSFVTEIEDERNELVYGKLTESLMQAVDEFIICCAVRNIRADRSKPMSMLIHVSQKIDQMATVRDIVEKYYDGLRARYADHDGKIAMRNEYLRIWKDFEIKAERINKELKLKNRLPDYKSIWNEIENVLPVIGILELNSISEDKLDYTTGEEIKVIAIGGNQLSRGLTLEGLMTSYYLRLSRQYDTLLQMARWFGYRMGYEDLTRVHTTDTLWDNFEHLALVEEEMRSEIYRYEEENRTPAELAIAIKDHRRLSVTAPNKMGAAKTKQVSFSESINQTIWYPLDRAEILRSNYNLGESFIRAISRDHKFKTAGSNYLARGVPGDWVLKEFLNKYIFTDRKEIGGAGLDSDGMLSYIFRRLNNENPELSKWNVALVSNVKPTGDNKTIKYGGLSVNPIQRSRKHTEKGYNIGVLTEPEHLRMDLKKGADNPHSGRGPQNPLLLLYPIWNNSKAARFVEKPFYGQRIDLYRFVDSEKIDVLGLAIVLPKSDYEPYNYIGQ